MLPTNIDPEMLKFMAANTEGYSWSDQLMGIVPESAGKTQVLEYTYPGCIACAAGLAYDLNTGDLRSESEREADRKALTLGISSLVASPLAGGAIASYGLRSVLTGAVLGTGFDGLGQSINGEEYRLGQSVVAGVTGGLAYPLAGASILGNAALGSLVGGSNASLKNYIYQEDANISESMFYGALGGIAGSAANKFISNALAKALPNRINGGVIDPKKAILLQNIGIPNPYPSYFGEVAGQITNGSIPLIINDRVNVRE